MDPLIEVKNLRFHYDDGTMALDGVGFRLFPGETVALLGANGSGKTTFILHLNGLLSGEGDIRVCGKPVTKKHLPEIRAKIGLLFQDPDEQLFMPTVIEDVAFGPLNNGSDPEVAERCARKALEEVGMGHAVDKAPYHLSAGEKRRVAMAGVLAMEPDILVLDEPTTYLDPPGQRDLLNLLRRLPQSKILVTHDTGFARKLASRAVFFRAGKIAGEGGVEEIIRQFEWEIPAPDLQRSSA